MVNEWEGKLQYYNQLLYSKQPVTDFSKCLPESKHQITLWIMTTNLSTILHEYTIPLPFFLLFGVLVASSSWFSLFSSPLLPVPVVGGAPGAGYSAGSTRLFSCCVIVSQLGDSVFFFSCVVAVVLMTLVGFGDGFGLGFAVLFVP